MRILITNNTLDTRSGSELYARDVAIGLLRRGHTPIAYSTRLGEVAEELRKATVPVVDDLNSVSVPPDIIHGQHHLETMTALLHFPGVPAVYFCHGWLPWEETPPRFPRIKRYVAVDDVCRERLIYREGIPEKQVSVIRNFVDLERFKRRAPLPQRPRRALVYSNNLRQDDKLRDVLRACQSLGIALDVVGAKNGNPSAEPERLLSHYDVVFTKGRSAFEALAVGAAVILFDEAGAGPLVTTAELDRLQRVNFGLRTLAENGGSNGIARELARYDPNDAAEVTHRIRVSAGLEATLDNLLSLYRDVVAEPRETNGDSAESEAHFVADYLRSVAARVGLERDAADRERDSVRRDLEAICSSASYRLANLIARAPLLGGGSWIGDVHPARAAGI